MNKKRYLANQESVYVIASLRKVLYTSKSDNGISQVKKPSVFDACGQRNPPSLRAVEGSVILVVTPKSIWELEHQDIDTIIIGIYAECTSIT